MVQKGQGEGLKLQKALNEAKVDETRARQEVVDAKLREAKAQEDRVLHHKTNKENALVWKGVVEQLKGQVIEATSRSEALQLEVDTLKQEKEEDMAVTILPPDTKA